MIRISTFALLSAIVFASCSNEPSKPATETKDTTATNSAAGGLKEENINYLTGSVNYKAYVAYNNDAASPKPAIIVVPEWWGLNDYAKTRAKQLADLGYVAMAIDMYGEGREADNPDTAGKLAGAFYGDPQLGKSKIDAAIAKLKTYPQVDPNRVAAIGYCFGGSMVLNAARLGSDLDGVVSFHGVLSPLPSIDKNNLKAQILVCHGGADKFTPSKDSLAFRKQLDEAGATYDFKTYPNSLHAFTNPKADEYAAKFKGLAVGYNADADKQSWEDMKAFLNKALR